MIFLTNANRLFNKMDELACLVAVNQYDVISITESWLSPDTPDSVYQLPDFAMFRRDRPDRLGGGVICYARSILHPQPLFPNTHQGEQFEMIWISIRPHVLPRPLSIIIIAVVYCPPWHDSNTKKLLIDHIIACIDILNKRYTCPGYLIMGDFNSLAIDFFRSRLNLKPTVKINTRANKILDNIFTNMTNYYNDAIITAPLGKSDHNCVILRPTDTTPQPVGKKLLLTEPFLRLRMTE